MQPRCVFCGKDCTDRDYCQGCMSYVCSGCEQTDPDQRPQGVEHEPQAHRSQVGAS